MAFARELLSHILEHYNIARKRSYIDRFCNGGGLTSLLSCDHVNVAGAAIVSGTVIRTNS